MHEYIVFDTNTSSRLVALMDQAGRHHVAHCTADLPLVDTRLHGAQAMSGFALMLGPRGAVYRLIFSHLDCGAQMAFDLVGVAGSAAPVPQRPHALTGLASA
jgi:hypothetical protein